MIGMQYKIILPKDYDMQIIRKRVQDNSHKTDGFPGLNFKAYLITEADKNGNSYNSYAPLYVWNNPEGMNHFIFDGFYDNILQSFGWQHINIGVPLTMNLHQDFSKSSYIVEKAGSIPEARSLIDMSFQSSNLFVKNAEERKGDLLFYNPDKWGYSQFSFYHEKPIIDSSEPLTVYEVLYVSQGS